MAWVDNNKPHLYTHIKITATPNSPFILSDDRVVVDSHAVPPVIQLSQDSTKTDPFGRGAMGKMNVSYFVLWLPVQVTRPDPYFIPSDGHHLLRDLIIAQVKVALSVAEVDQIHTAEF